MKPKSEYLKKLPPEYPCLRRTFERYWETPLAEYAPNLYSKPPETLEEELKESLAEEWRFMGLDSETIDAALRQLESKPVLQTSHHITPTNGLGFLAIDAVSLAGLKKDEFYLVGANSGVAFSNSAWSGALSYGNLSLDRILKPGSPAFRQAKKADAERRKHGAVESRVSLIPSRQRDRIVYGAKINSFQTELFQQFSPSLSRLLPAAKPGTLWSHWAAEANARIQKRILRRPNILIFDINRTISRYLTKVLSNNPGHPVERILFHAPTRDRVDEIFQRQAMFLGSAVGKKSPKVDVLFWKKQGLESLKTGFRPYGKKELVQTLREEKLCPGIFPLFFILRFLNGVRCLGSFSQIEYLERFRRNWEKLDIGWPLDLEPDYSQMLTTGRMPEEICSQMPLDMALDNRRLELDSLSGMKMKSFWKPIVNRLAK